MIPTISVAAIEDREAIVNRLPIPYLLSAIRMLDESAIGCARPSVIAASMSSRVANPCLADLLGLDTTLPVAEVPYGKFKEPLGQVCRGRE